MIVVIAIVMMALGSYADLWADVNTYMNIDYREITVTWSHSKRARSGGIFEGV